jgi:hypothetical protein
MPRDILLTSEAAIEMKTLTYAASIIAFGDFFILYYCKCHLPFSSSCAASWCSESRHLPLH